MCLAVPARITARSGETADVNLNGNRLIVSTVLTPDAAVGDWVLVHAGFAISVVDEREALETWDYLREQFAEEALQEAGAAEQSP